MQLKKNWYIVIVVIGIVLVCAVVLYLQNSPQKFSGPPEPVIINTAPSPSSTLILIADDKGFFARHGLNVTVKQYSSSLTSLNNLVAGTADVAGVSGYTFMNYLFTEPTLQTFASTAKIDVVSIMARRDRGIATPQDLAGKKIGVTKQQIGEYFFARYIILNGINSSTLTIVNLPITEMSGALANGTIDAAIVWEPYIGTIQKQMGSNVVTIPAQEGQSYNWVMVCTNKTATERPGMIRNFLAALVDAESYTQQYPEEAQQIVANKLGLDPTYVRAVWPKYHPIVSLDQSLITLMESEGRFAIQTNLTDKREIPNYRGNIYRDGLDAVKPEAVTVIR